MFETVEEVRQKMLTAWDGIYSLHARARKKVYRVNAPGRSIPQFVEPDDLSIVPYHYEAWWQDPDSWRHDCELPSRPVTLPHQQISYIAIGDTWRVKEEGVVQKSGTVVESQQTDLTRGDGLWFGRPYLAAKDNRFLWDWLNPQLWAASMDLIVTDKISPLPDDVFHDPAIVHVLAGWWSVGRSPSIAEQRQWDLTSEDRDTEILDYTNFCQLWVDMRTGFCRRIAGEAANGRSWDIVIDELTINEPGGIAREVFHS